MRNTIAVVSLKRIKKNAELVGKRAESPLIAVVKDDGYGHGAEAVACALHGVASAFAVSSADEGAALRIAGVSEEIIVLSPPVSRAEAMRAAEYGLTVTVSSFAVLRLVAEAARGTNLLPKAHLAVNTGMNRYGFRPEALQRACESARGLLDITGVYSHFYAPEDERARETQYRMFCGAARTVRGVYPDAMRHLSATGGILAGQKYNFDAVRSGIALYGYLPAGFGGALAVKPAMKVYAAVAQSGTFTGGGAGYGAADREYAALHTLRFGYGDGFFREGGLGVGKLCMDACVREGRAKTGSWKLILKDAAAYAARHDTTAYEVLTSAGERAVKYYV